MIAIVLLGNSAGWPGGFSNDGGFFHRNLRIGIDCISINTREFLGSQIFPISDTRSNTSASRFVHLQLKLMWRPASRPQWNQDDRPGSPRIQCSATTTECSPPLAPARLAIPATEPLVSIRHAEHPPASWPSRADRPRSGSVDFAIQRQGLIDIPVDRGPVGMFAEIIRIAAPNR
jgi:hypothetical protein